MLGCKSLLESKTFWGAMVAMASAVLSLGNYTLSPADTASLVDLCSGIASAVGAIVAIYGRIVATKKIDGVV